MQIEVTCPCGKLFTLPAALAGRSVRCPVCQQMVQAPRDAPILAEVATRASRHPEQVSWAQPKASGGQAETKSGWAMLLAVLGVCAVMIFGFVIFLGLIIFGFRSSGSVATTGTFAAPLAVGPVELPERPLTLDKVRPPTAADLAPNHDVEAIEQEVLRLHADGKYDEALPLQYWVVNHSNRGAYNMACLYSLLGDVDAAMYWLQESFARGEGTSSSYASQDSDLEAVWADPRWTDLREYLAQCELHYVNRLNSYNDRSLIPANGGGPAQRLVIVLHGLGQRPEDILSADCQRLADRENLIFVAPQGPQPVGPNSFQWSKRLEANLQAIESALTNAGMGVQEIPPKQRVLVGFSQGGSVAAELIAAYPDRFGGAVILSPIDEAPEFDASIAKAWAQHSFVIAHHTQEHADVIDSAEKLASGLEKTGARVRRETLGDSQFHELPEQPWERIAKWIDFVAPGAKDPDGELDANVSAGKPAVDKPAVDKPAVDKPAVEKPAVEKPAEEKPAVEKPAEEKPAEEKPAEEKPVVEKPGEEKPGEEKPAVGESGEQGTC